MARPKYVTLFAVQVAAQCVVEGGGTINPLLQPQSGVGNIGGTNLLSRVRIVRKDRPVKYSY
jgi:hypothetical protein